MYAKDVHIQVSISVIIARALVWFELPRLSPPSPATTLPLEVHRLAVVIMLFRVARPSLMRSRSSISRRRGAVSIRAIRCNTTVVACRRGLL